MPQTSTYAALGRLGGDVARNKPTSTTTAGAADRRVEYMPLSEVQPAVRNPKLHAGDEIRASISRFGLAETPLLDERTGRLVAGHGRIDQLIAMRNDGETPPSGVRTDATGEWLTPVLRGWASRSDAEAEAYLAASNQLTILGGWDSTALGELLADLDAADPDLLALTGFSDDDLAALLDEDEADQPPTGSDTADAPLDPPAEPVCQVGDVWALGPHRLFVGDCTGADTAERLGIIKGVDLILTDPPYCSGGFQEAGKSAGSVGTGATHKQIANDRLSTRGYQALLKAALNGVPASYAYVFTDWRMWTYLFDLVEASGFGVRSMIVWDKSSPGMGRGWRSQHELVMWGARKTPPFDKHASGQGNVVQAARTGNDLHTTQKPVDLLAVLLETVPFVATVYDPFAGSGTTLIAAHRTGRTAYLCELDPGYADVICRRWQEHTLQMPLLAATGEPHDFTQAP